MQDACTSRRVKEARAAQARACTRALGRALAWALVVAMPIAGCGLKGPLTLPEKSKNVVIRPGPGGATAPATSPAPETEPLPPPELPPDTRGNTRG